MLKSLIGDKKFYKHVLVLVIPIFIQNFITNFVNMLDNLMVGKIGQVEMTGVSVTNQLIFVFNLVIFGAISGAGIFGAQFVGSGDVKGLRDTFRFKLVSCVLLTLAACGIFLLFGDTLIHLYLKGEGDVTDAARSLSFGKDYLLIMLIGFIPYTVSQCYASTLREKGQTVLPMAAGIAAVCINLFLNWVLIFGNLGAPVLGVKGAATATVISRFAELIIVVLFTHLTSEKNTFIKGAYKSFKIPAALCKNIIKKGTPLMINETMWAAGMAFVAQCYSVRGLDVVAANTITTTFFNVFSVAFISLGAAIGIILGQLLGVGKLDEAYDSSKKLIAFSVAVSTLIGGLFALCANFIPQFYEVSGEVRELATKLMWVSACIMPLDSFANAAYFTLRSGGQATITMIFDSGFVWAAFVPVAYILANFTNVPIIPLYITVNALTFFKDVLGFIFVKRKKWLKNIVSEQ